MNRPLLGVLILARDEESTILRCLESVRTVAEEYIVVDTGSVDRTPDIAREFGARVIPIEWEEDFAKARNAGLFHARADWILCLDADEVLIGADSGWLEELKHSGREGFWVTIENAVGPGPEDRVFHQALRLFRRRDMYRFTGRIHEDIAPSILRRLGPGSVQVCPWSIYHEGYMPEVLDRKNKPIRNLRLLRLALRENPGDPFYQYNLGITFSQLKRPAAAIRWMYRAVSSAPPEAPYRPTLWRDLAVLLLSVGRAREVELALRPELERYPDYADLHVLFGDSLREQGFLEEALEAYRRAARVSPSDRYVSTAGMNTFRPLHAAAELCRELGRFDEAAGLERRALAALPGWFPALAGLAEALAALGTPDPDILLEVAALCGSQPDPGVLARVMGQIGAYREALQLLRGKEDREPPAEWEPLYLECLLQTGQFTEAYSRIERYLQKGRPKTGDPEHWARDLALCRWAEDRPLPYGVYQMIPEHLRSLYAALDRWMERDPAPQAGSAGDREAIRKLMERAVQLRLLSTAARLAGHPAGPFHLDYAKMLYQNGFVYRAADRLLDLLAQGELDAEGLFFLGELLYDKGHWDQARQLFEQALALDPEMERARAGAAASALESARCILESLCREHPHPETFADDLRAVRQSLDWLKGFRWHTHWRGTGRRNRRASADDLPVYDRQE
ncbi:MAG: glycosyltransferase [Alicyclobacillaceae bacterium]|nr:glycosyltransferase [Alicyclobacillaceae bacterium]